jgi:hypothetical protein
MPSKKKPDNSKGNNTPKSKGEKKPNSKDGNHNEDTFILCYMFSSQSWLPKNNPF